MDKIIPLHSLVMVMENDYRSSVSEAKRLFPNHEIITPDTITMDLVGQSDRSDLINICLSEIRHKISLKLSMGERVVLVAPSLSRKDYRVNIAKLGMLQGASIIYIVSDLLIDSDLLCGDHIANVIKSSEKIKVINPEGNTLLPSLKTNFRGITILGDVHGSLKMMQRAIAWAKSRNHFLIFLGDVIDCGSETLETLITTYDTVMRGEGAFVLGNHERKIARWLSNQENPDGRSMKLSEGNRITINAYKSLPFEQRQQWAGKFRSLLSRASLMTQLGNITFVHAAVHADYWRHALNVDHQSIEDFALYGEVGYSRPNDTTIFHLTYRWIDHVPAGKTVFCGHDVRSTNAPLVVTGAKGGRVIFLDTGAGKGGILSTADVRFRDNNTLELENFNQHNSK